MSFLKIAWQFYLIEAILTHDVKLEFLIVSYKTVEYFVIVDYKIENIYFDKTLDNVFHRRRAF